MAAQTNPGPRAAGAVATRAETATAKDYRLAAGDKLRIEVYKDPQLSQALQVGFRASRLTRQSKRLFDILLALTGLLLAAPSMLLTGVAIWLESGSPMIARPGAGAIPPARGRELSSEGARRPRHGRLHQLTAAARRDWLDAAFCGGCRGPGPRPQRRRAATSSTLVCDAALVFGHAEERRTADRGWWKRSWPTSS